MRTWPSWRLQGLNEQIVLATLIMTVGLLIGWMSFGLTAWAFTSKYLGWFVLLSYGATGALIVGVAGQTGCIVLLRTFIAAGVAICAVEIALLEMRYMGLPIDINLAPLRASGLAANPNAFAMQILLVACATLVAIRSQRLMATLLAIALTAIWLSASRAGLGAATVVLAAATIVRPTRRRPILYALLATAGIVFLLEAATAIPAQIAYELASLGSPPPSHALVWFGPLAAELTAPDTERWKNNPRRVIALFRAPSARRGPWGLCRELAARAWRSPSGSFDADLAARGIRPRWRRDHNPAIPAHRGAFASQCHQGTAHGGSGFF